MVTTYFAACILKEDGKNPEGAGVEESCAAEISIDLGGRTRKVECP